MKGKMHEFEKCRMQFKAFYMIFQTKNQVIHDLLSVFSWSFSTLKGRAMYLRIFAGRNFCLRGYWLPVMSSHFLRFRVFMTEQVNHKKMMKYSTLDVRNLKSYASFDRTTDILIA